MQHDLNLELEIKSLVLKHDSSHKMYELEGKRTSESSYSFAEELQKRSEKYFSKAQF